MPTFKQNTKFERGINLFGVSRGEYIAKNWHTSQVLTDLGDATLYQQIAAAWYTFGVSGANTAYAVSTDGSDWYNLGTLSNFQVACALQDSHVAGSGALIVGGGLSTGTLYKIKRSLNHGTSWTNIQVTGLSDAMICGALAYTSSGYFARLDSDVFWSPTGDSSSWNLVLTLPSTSETNNLCTNGSLVVAYCNTGSSYFTTSSSASWTTQTFPSSFVAAGMTFDGSKFIVIGHDSTGPAVYTSPDAVSYWSLVHRFPSGTTLSSLASLDVGVLVGCIILSSGGINIFYSPDSGVTWYPATTYNSYLNVSVVAAKRYGDDAPHQVGIFKNGLAKMSIVG